MEKFMGKNGIQSVWKLFSQLRDKVKDKNATKEEKNKYLELKNLLVKEYFELVKKIARNFAKNINYNLLEDELASYGVNGLYRAIEAFDTNRNVKFETYAYARIKGSMYDGIRSDDWVPRSVRVRYNKIESAKTELEAENCGAVFEKEALEKAGFSEEEYLKNPKKFNPVMNCSIDCNAYGDDEDLHKDMNSTLVNKKNTSPESSVIRKEFFKKLLSEEFDGLEKKIIYLYYYENLTIKETAKRINISDSRTSQLHRKVLKKLKQKILSEKDYFDSDVLRSIVECNDRDSLF